MTKRRVNKTQHMAVDKKNSINKQYMQIPDKIPKSTTKINRQKSRGD